MNDLRIAGRSNSAVPERIASNGGASQRRLKHLVLVDAVEWSDRFPPESPFRDVRRWFARWLEGIPDLRLTRVAATEDVIGTIGKGVDGVILSGSPRDAWRDDPINERMCALVGLCRDRSLPFLGVCYGHQILARALCGQVAPHPDGLELGNTWVDLSSAAQTSDLFDGLPARLNALSSHADAVLTMPPGAELLVRGSHTRIQGIRFGRVLYGVQFHPETDPDTLRFLWSVRRDAWRSRVTFDLDRALDGLHPTPEAANILRNFATRVVA